MFSFIWWIIGFYWVSDGGESLPHGAPQLYWLCIMFLAFEVVFVVICVLIACLIGVAVCCCLPCIIAVLYALTDQEGATKEDIDQLPKFKFHKLDDSSKVNGEIQESFQGMMIKCYMIAPLNAPFYGRCYFDKYKKEIMLLSVDCGHPDYTSFKPEKRHAEKVEPSGDHSASDSESQNKLVVAEIYKPSVHVNPIFRATCTVFRKPLMLHSCMLNNRIWSGQQTSLLLSWMQYFAMHCSRGVILLCGKVL